LVVGVNFGVAEEDALAVGFKLETAEIEVGVAELEALGLALGRTSGVGVEGMVAIGFAVTATVGRATSVSFCVLFDRKENTKRPMIAITITTKAITTIFIPDLLGFGGVDAAFAISDLG